MESNCNISMWTLSSVLAAAFPKTQDSGVPAARCSNLMEMSSPAKRQRKINERAHYQKENKQEEKQTQ